MAFLCEPDQPVAIRDDCVVACTVRGSDRYWYGSICRLQFHSISSGLGFAPYKRRSFVFLSVRRRVCGHDRDYKNSRETAFIFSLGKVAGLQYRDAMNLHLLEIGDNVTSAAHAVLLVKLSLSKDYLRAGSKDSSPQMRDAYGVR